MQSSQGAPPPEVLVLERNSKVVLDVAQALESAYAGDAVKGEEGNGLEVAVLYGGLHLKVRWTVVRWMPLSAAVDPSN